MALWEMKMVLEKNRADERMYIVLIKPTSGMNKSKWKAGWKRD